MNYIPEEWQRATDQVHAEKGGRSPYLDRFLSYGNIADVLRRLDDLMDEFTPDSDELMGKIVDTKHAARYTLLHLVAKSREWSPAPAETELKCRRNAARSIRKMIAEIDKCSGIPDVRGLCYLRWEKIKDASEEKPAPFDSLLALELFERTKGISGVEIVPLLETLAERMELGQPLAPIGDRAIHPDDTIPKRGKSPQKWFSNHLEKFIKEITGQARPKLVDEIFHATFGNERRR